MNTVLIANAQRAAELLRTEGYENFTFHNEAPGCFVFVLENHRFVCVFVDGSVNTYC